MTGLTLVMIFALTQPVISTPRPDSTGTPSNLPNTIIQDLEVAFGDAIGFYSAPFSFGTDEWYRTAAGTGAQPEPGANDSAQEYPDWARQALDVLRHSDGTRFT